ncbi:MULTISPECIES: helix-turn-helix domain-containing protein [Providencia]|nr:MULTISPECIES: helix-turn-helix transcriptional regulator [Providencia]MBP6121727.1 helix-turn-helix transcriptional regulator [Providencia sp.]MDD9341576.1 helix-turn-helix transcriptional regulator [Providencia heimbachae]NIH22029.1 helix-turn-helix transcriptional regulator [Providencia heimbachae]QCJ69504.1 XRE family transcriptional regulator [Providencia heimbachae]
MNDKKIMIASNNFYSSIIGGEIRKVRKLRMLSGTKVAKRLGVSQQQYSRYECGICSISVDMLFNLLYILEYDLNYFFTQVSLSIKNKNNDIYNDLGTVLNLANTHKDIESYFYKKE